MGDAQLFLDLRSRLANAEAVDVEDKGERTEPGEYAITHPCRLCGMLGEWCRSSQGPFARAAILREKPIHDLPVYVRQTEVTALKTVCQLGVVEPEQMQDGRVQVVYVHFVLDSVEAQLITFAERNAGF